MSFKSILVHASAAPSCDRRVRLAVQLADMFEASLTGLGAEAFDPTFVSGYGIIDGAMIEAVRERTAVDLLAAEQRFRELAAPRQGLAWITGEDLPERLLAFYARGADLIVASRPGRYEGPTFDARPADLIMQAGAPVLLAAGGDAVFRGERVVVGWKDTRESRRALADALPFLVRAKGVVIVAVGGDAGAQTDRTGLKDVVKRLAEHGVDASVDVVTTRKAGVAEALEAAADRHSADLIVTGAYGHSRLREWTLGGVTEEFIKSSSKFLLLSH
jgi:nucleotide-binding universal stress UspA family protein